MLLVENAVSASEVDDDLKDEFAEECNKFGKVKNVRILDGSDGGDVKILIEFETIDGKCFIIWAVVKNGKSQTLFP